MQFLAHLDSVRAALNREEMMESTLAATAAFVIQFTKLFTNFPLISALTASLVSQFTKLFIFRYKESRWDFKKLVGSGGMPSSHSATATAVAAAIALQEGFGGPPFATALVSACVVMHDATCARLKARAQARQQAEVVNQNESELPTTEPRLAESTPLHTLLGHTSHEVVVGGLLGVFTAVIIDSTTGLPVYQYCRANVHHNYCILPSRTYFSESLSRNLSRYTECIQEHAHMLMSCE